ncbi:MAG TPA: ferric reductase-like transmembrane domain-containing protein [Solirubrobacteraceae bacterium]|nr:ferric reductase-like transmembrane domain-containing protein [Solirubrobacteraceae bacterium]
MGAPASAVPDIRGSSPAPPLRRRPGRGAQLLAVGAGIGLAATLALVPGSEQPGALSARGEVLIALGRLCGLAGAYALLISVLLVARLAPLERAVEHPQLVRWHRRLAPWTLLLIAAHGALVAGGYAQQARTGPLRELWLLITTFPGVLAATVGFLLLAAAGVTSYRRLRRRMAYETWWTVHLYTYSGSRWPSPTRSPPERRSSAIPSRGRPGPSSGWGRWAWSSPTASSCRCCAPHGIARASSPRGPRRRESCRSPSPDGR